MSDRGRGPRQAELETLLERLAASGLAFAEARHRALTPSSTR